MTLIEAIATGRPLTRKDKVWTYVNDQLYAARAQSYSRGFFDPYFLLQHMHLMPEDVLAKDWIVQGELSETDFEDVI